MNLLTPFLRAIKVWVDNTFIGERKGIRFQAGSGIQITGTEDASNERINILITSTGGSGGGGNTYATITDGTDTISATGVETLLLTSPNNSVQIKAVAASPDRVEFQIGSHTHSASDITSGRFTQARMPTSATANRFLVVRTANADPIYDVVDWTDVVNKPSSFPPSAHTHDAADVVSGRFTQARMPTSATANRFLVVRTANGDPVYDVVNWTDVANKPTSYSPDAHTHSASDIISGRFTQARMPTSTTANRFLVVRTANSNPTYDIIQVSDLPSHTHTRSQITDFAHQITHQAGGSDELTGNLNAIARTTVRVNNGTDIGSRRRLNFIAGANVTISAADDSVNEEIDITISASGGSAGVANAYSAVKVGSTTLSAIGEETLELSSPNGTIQITPVAGSPDRVEFQVGSHTHSASDITSGRFTQARMPTSATANRFLVVRTANGDPVYDVVDWVDIQNKPSSFPPGTHTHDAADIVSGRFTQARMPTSATANRFLVVRTANSDPTYDVLQASDLPSHTHSASDITSGRFVQARMPTSATANRFLVVRTANNDPTYDVIQASDLPSHTHTRSQITDFAHQATHQAGGSDALSGNLDAIARTTVRINNQSTNIGSRRRLHFVAGSNVTINATDEGNTEEEVKITISATPSVDAELDYDQVWLSTDYLVSQNNQWYNILSVTLAAGVWLVTAQALAYSPLQGAQLWLARLYDNNNLIAQHPTVQTMGEIGVQGAYVPLQIVSLLEIPLLSTIYLQVRSENGTQSGTIKGVNNSWSPISPTWLKAVKIAPYRYV